jgi:hypothetical protein
VGEGNPEPQNILADVNARIREVAGRSTAHADEWEFLCECGRPGCEERVFLSIAEYEARVGGNEPILAPGHRPATSTPA